MSQVQAIAKGVRMSPRKVGIVAGLVRGRSVADALVILEHTPRRAAKPVAKAIASAKANAVNNHGLKEDTLKVEVLDVTSGPTMKRFRPVARGSAHRIMKRSSHIRVILTGETKPARPAKAAATKETKE